MFQGRVHYPKVQMPSSQFVLVQHSLLGPISHPFAVEQLSFQIVTLGEDQQQEVAPLTVLKELFTAVPQH